MPVTIPHAPFSFSLRNPSHTPLTTLLLAAAILLLSRPGLASTPSPSLASLNNKSSSTTQSSVPDSNNKELVISRLMALTNAKELFLRGMNMGLKQQKQVLAKRFPDVPESIFDWFTDEVSKELEESTTIYMGALSKVYTRHYTIDELRDLIQFYSTTTGQKSIRLMPIIMQESLQINQTLSQHTMERTLKRVGDEFNRRIEEASKAAQEKKKAAESKK